MLCLCIILKHHYKTFNAPVFTVTQGKACHQSCERRCFGKLPNECCHQECAGGCSAQLKTDCLVRIVFGELKYIISICCDLPSISC